MSGGPCSHGSICSVGETIYNRDNSTFLSSWNPATSLGGAGGGGSLGKTAEEVTMHPNIDKSRQDLDGKGEGVFQVQEKVCSKT